MLAVVPREGERAAHNTRARTARGSTRAMITTSASLLCSVSIATIRRGWRGASSSGRTPSAHETVPAAVHAPRIRASPLRRTPRAPGAVAEPPGPTSPMTDTSSSNWRDNPFARYCDDAMAIPEVVEGLRVLEQTHPEIDGNVVLFAVWRATRGGDDARLRHQINRRSAGRVCDPGKKGAADKKVARRWVRPGPTVHPARARARALVGSATARRPAGPRRGLLLHRGPSLVHHRRRSIDVCDGAAFVRNLFLGHRPEPPPFATVGDACHESRRAELTRPVDVRTSERVSGHSVRPARGPRLGARSE